MRNRALILLSVLALAAVSFAVWRGGGKSTEGEGENEFRKTQVRAGDFLHTVTATGRVIPDTEVEVTSKAGGEITEMPYDEGDWVKVGQLLARLDPDDELRNVKRSQASLRAAVARKAKAENELELAESTYRKSMTDAEAAIQLTQTKLADAEAKHRRQEGLFAAKLIPEELLETSRTTLAQARTDRIQALAALEDAKSLSQRIELRKEEITLAEVEVINAELSLEEVNERLDETEIRAPMAGVITHRPVEPGQVISSAISNVGGGTLLMIISDLSTLFVVAAVDETDIGGIRIDQEAMIKTDAYPDEAFEGRVDRIAPKGIDGGGVVTFNVEIKVQGKGLNRLKPGMTADVDIILEKSVDTKWVESDAIQKGPKGQYVELMGAEGRTERIPVEVGLSDGIRTEIIGDVSEGQELVIRESDGDSAWQRGEGGKRPLKDNMDNVEIRRRRK